MNVAGESSKIYLLDLVSLGYESESDGLGSRGLVVPDPGVYNYSLPVGTVTILCVDGSVVTRRACDVKVVDRSYFYPGQLVGPTSDLSGQIGVITGVAVVLDLIEHNVCGESTKVIKGVAPCRLRRVKGLSLGDYVVSGSWLGRVVEVSIDVDVLFDDGAICKITNAESKMLRSAAKSDVHYRPEMNSLFYPGQCVTGDPRAVFKASRWLNGYWKPDRKVGIVSKVEVSGVLVYWIASAHRGTEQQFVQAFAPPAYQNPDDLTLFCSASDCTWGVADMCFFRTETDDDAASNDDDHHQKDQHYACSDLDDQHDTTDDERESPTTPAAVPTKKREEVRLHRKQLRKVYFDGHRRARCLDVAEFELPMSVANTRTTVDVLWQDGTRQLGAPSTSVVPFKIVNEQEFFPGQYVVDNAFPEANVPIDDVAGHYAGSAVPTTTISTTETVAGSSKLTRRAGFVRSLNCKDQMVHVSWFKAASCPSESREIDRSDTVSAYNLGRDPDHRAYYGDVVVRLLPSGSTYGPSSPVQPSTTRASNNKNKAATAAADLSWVGRVVDLPDGHVQVKWGDGSMSTVLPHEICVIDEQNYEDLQAEMGDWVEDDGSDPPEEQAADYTENDPRNNSNIEGNGVPADGDGPAAIITGRLGSAVWSVIRLASKVLALAKWTLSALSSSEFSAARENVGAPETVPASGDDPSNGAATETIAAIVPSDDSAKERKETADATGSGNDELFCFPHFDIRESPPDHHYLDTVDQGDSGGKRWVKIVQREWKILENNLPDTIYVRAFEDRIDLLRAVVVGASGTPYHDGLFFFDLQLPPSYPVAPPQVYYHSFGLRLNPNLYASGTVCLSLLNTFGGEGTEVWSSTTSSLLQVVVSIQGLVLNNQPYYNEAGYETLAGTAEGRRNALPYNENAYLLTLRTVLHLLHRPPLGFEEFVRDHFRRRGKFVLRACEAYLQGCDVGTLSSDGRATKRSREQPCSAGLRLALSNLVPRLETAFKEIGAEGCLKVHDPQV